MSALPTFHVIPANAGTHLRWVTEHATGLWRMDGRHEMGPRFRGDDNGSEAAR